MTETGTCRTGHHYPNTAPDLTLTPHTPKVKPAPVGPWGPIARTRNAGDNPVGGTFNRSPRPKVIPQARQAFT